MVPAASHRVADIILPNATYAQMKKYAWAVNDADSRIHGFFRYRQATREELVHLESGWEIWSDASGARIVRPATPAEVAAKGQQDREWQIAMDTDYIICAVCERLGIQMNEHAVLVKNQTGL